MTPAALRVLHVIPSLSSVHGGPSHAMRTIDAALRDAGICVDIATTDDDGLGRHLDRPLGQPMHEDEDTSHGAHWYFRKNTEFYKCSWSFARWIARRVHEYDLVHIHALFSFTSVIAARAARRRGVPYIVRPLGTLSPYGMQVRRAWLKRVSLRWIEGPLLEGAAAVHVTSDLERNEVESLGLKTQCVTIPLGLPRAADSGNVRPLTSIFPQLAYKRVVLFLSRLDRKKNVEGLIEAFSMIAADFPDCVLLVAGTGDPRYVAQLKEMAFRTVAAERILWLGHIERELKAAAFAAAKLFVLPSYSENFGIAAAEALAAGVPCLLGDGVALAESVAATGAGLATSTDAVSVATAMRLILADESRRLEMSTRAREFAEREHSSSVMADRLSALYNRIIPASAEGDDVSAT